MTSAARVVAQFLRYVAVGATGTLVHYALLFALVEGFGTGVVAASTVGAVAGAVVNYLLNHRYTFASARRHRDAALRFAVVSVLGIALNAAVVAFLIRATALPYGVAQIVATIAVVLYGFVVNRRWTF